HTFANAVVVLAPCRFRIDDDLNEPVGVAYVEEHHAAVVAPVRDPAADHDLSADVLGAQVTRPVRPHHDLSESSRVRSHAATSSRRTSTCFPVARCFTPTLPSASSRGASSTPHRAPA